LSRRDVEFGWGDPLESHLYPEKVNRATLAVGGTGARTFRSTYWPDVLPLLRTGDVVLIHFGHNDNGTRGAPPGIG
jgi:lysophospholipase L1-like esterase